MDMTEAIMEAYAYADPDITIYETLEISHSSWLDSIFLVNDHRELSTLQGTYQPVKFDIALPETEEAVRGEMTVTIEFLPKEYRDKLYEAAGLSDMLKIQYRQYIAADSDPDAELPVALTVSNVAFDTEAYTTELTALYPDLVNLPFCRRIMTTTALPGGKV